MKINYPSVNDEGKTKSQLCNETINHCQKWRDYYNTQSLTNSRHEIMHCISSDIRVGNNSFTTFNHLIGNDLNGIYPKEEMRGKSYGSGRNNAFYIGNDTAYVFQEPNLVKTDAAPFIKDVFKLSRYRTYIIGQTAWNDTPLYIYDEWNAYIAGTECAVEIGKAGNTEPQGSDIAMGPMEFAIYGLSLCMAIEKQDPSSLTKEFLEFTQLQLTRSIQATSECLKYYNWSDTTKLIDNFMSEPGQIYRDFLESKLGTKLTRKDFDTI